jgi:hypothetical protein
VLFEEELWAWAWLAGLFEFLGRCLMSPQGSLEPLEESFEMGRHGDSLLFLGVQLNFG